MNLHSQIKKISEVYVKQKIFLSITKSVLNLATKQKRLLVRFLNDELIAFLIWKEYKNSIYISSFCVEENQRRLGIGKEFLSFIKELSKSKNKDLRLSVAKRNDKAISFYLKEGFVFLNKEKEDRYKSIATYEMIYK